MFLVHMAVPLGGSPWTASESRPSTADHTDNMQKIVTITSSCQKNINDKWYKQGPLISERPHDFKQSDGLWGIVGGAGQGNMMK